jgi:16S rRNA (cytosine967-C5)-methyltransferase
MRSHSYINSASTILQVYDGQMPFAAWLKQFFKEYKKYGSKDRKEIAHLCYSFFRLGKAFEAESVEERILTGVFLSSNKSNFVLQELRQEWNDKIHLPLREKLALVYGSLASVFPWKEALSEVIKFEQLVASFFIQPDLFIRLRPGKEVEVKQKLEQAAVHFENVSEQCLALPNSSKLDVVLELNREAVIQDYSSQRIGEMFSDVLPQAGSHKISVWDCCAASGGKSILAYDLLPAIELTVSDIRKSILFNLQKRFKEAGINRYKSFVADLSTATYQPSSARYDLVICDAPCTGSGTWGRTPEQLYFFTEEKIAYYAALQKSIVLNASKSVKAGGYFLYITCSVFKQENEELVSQILQHTSLQLLKQQYFIGYQHKADTLFAALFQL